jgi:hypothetical protein
MSNSPIASLSKHFENLTAPRAEHGIDHLLIDLIIITICAVICGANNWVEIENYGHAKREWLETFLELPLPCIAQWFVHDFKSLSFLHFISNRK